MNNTAKAKLTGLKYKVGRATDGKLHLYVQQRDKKTGQLKPSAYEWKTAQNTEEELSSWVINDL